MPDINHFKPPGQTLFKPLLKQQTRTPKQTDFQLDMVETVLVPHPLDNLRPSLDLLDFVNDQQVSAIRLGPRPCRIPFCGKPIQRRKPKPLRQFVGVPSVIPGNSLLNRSGLSNLTRPGNNLYPLSRLKKPP